MHAAQMRNSTNFPRSTAHWLEHDVWNMQNCILLRQYACEALRCYKDTHTMYAVDFLMNTSCNQEGPRTSAEHRCTQAVLVQILANFPEGDARRPEHEVWNTQKGIACR